MISLRGQSIVLLFSITMSPFTSLLVTTINVIESYHEISWKQLLQKFSFFVLHCFDDVFIIIREVEEGSTGPRVWQLNQRLITQRILSPDQNTENNNTDLQVTNKITLSTLSEHHAKKLQFWHYNFHFPSFTISISSVTRLESQFPDSLPLTFSPMQSKKNTM